jgi:cyanophycinase-like exopeptidase
VQVIMGGESRIFGAKSFFQFGTYAVDESKSMFVLHPEASSISKFAGSTQRRIIRSLTREELKITNPANSSGAKVESVWKRVD